MRAAAGRLVSEAATVTAIVACFLATGGRAAVAVLEVAVVALLDALDHLVAAGRGRRLHSLADGACFVAAGRSGFARYAARACAAAARAPGIGLRAVVAAA